MFDFFFSAPVLFCSELHRDRQRGQRLGIDLSSALHLELAGDRVETKACPASESIRERTSRRESEVLFSGRPRETSRPETFLFHLTPPAVLAQQKN